MIKSLGEKHPDTQKASFIAPDSAILGDVTLAEGTSVWYGAVIRGDLDHITIGKNSNVQDNCTLHGDRGYPITLGEGVSIGSPVREFLNICSNPRNLMIPRFTEG